jgi:hypothetical protein
MEATSTADRPTMLTEDRLWRPEKAAWYLDVKPSWIYEAVRTGRLPCHRVGRSRASSSRAARDAQHSRRSRAAIVAAAAHAEQNAEFTHLVNQTETEISPRWMEDFYPIYATAQSTFGVNWLLIASIHKQESAFSTAPTTYHGLNFAGCCGGPMQFNVTNGGRGTGSGSTWDLVSDSYKYGKSTESARLSMTT